MAGRQELVDLHRIEAEFDEQARLGWYIRAFDVEPERPRTRTPSIGGVSVFEITQSAIRIDFETLGRSRKQVVAALKGRGVGTQVHYYPVPLQPFYRKRFGHGPGDFPEAERHYAQALTIPLYPGLSDDQVARVSEVVREVLA